MCLLAPENPYPIYALPPLVRNAIIETQKNTQAPLAMVATSALTATSIACQNQVDGADLEIYVGLLIFTL